jgi:hypothetical protein
MITTSYYQVYRSQGLVDRIKREDVLDALPPMFLGGTRSIEKLCYQIRDNIFGQITQLFEDTADTTVGTTVILQNNNQNTDGSVDVASGRVGISARQLVAQYLQDCLQQYIDHNCIPPEIGQPYTSNDVIETTPSLPTNTDTAQQKQQFAIARTGNVTLPRPVDDDAVSTNEVGYI